MFQEIERRHDHRVAMERGKHRHEFLGHPAVRRGERRPQFRHELRGNVRRIHAVPARRNGEDPQVPALFVRAELLEVEPLEGGEQGGLHGRIAIGRSGKREQRLQRDPGLRFIERPLFPFGHGLPLQRGAGRAADGAILVPEERPDHGERLGVRPAVEGLQFTTQFVQRHRGWIGKLSDSRRRAFLPPIRDAE